MAETCRVIKVHRILLKSNTFTSTVTEGRVRGKNIENLSTTNIFYNRCITRKRTDVVLKCFLISPSLLRFGFTIDINPYYSYKRLRKSFSNMLS